MSASPTYGELTNQGASTNIAWHQASVDRSGRAEQRGHRSAILWFTGLSGSGKSTLANAVNAALFKRGLATYVLDGDNVRHGLCKDLGFSDADREENIRRIGEVAKLFLDAGVIVLTAFVSPFRADRDKARDLVENGDFLEAEQMLRRAYALDNGESDAIRDNLRLALAKIENPGYDPDQQQDYALVRLGSGSYLIRRTF